MLGLLIQFLVLCIGFGAIMYVIKFVPLDPPWATVARVVIGAIFLIALLYMLLGVTTTGPYSVWGRV